MNYYNENDRFAAAWLRELIADNLITPGIVDTRSIKDVSASDLNGFGQCHFFAGIGGWSYALRLAGWPDNEPVWTGSCPCQPFSSAGHRKVDKDERHLWPAFRALISERAPAIIFGEQVASADGRIWLAGIRADLEAMGNVFGAADLCAAGVGAPHPRQRLYWMAHSNKIGWRKRVGNNGFLGSSTTRLASAINSVEGMADSDQNGEHGELECEGIPPRQGEEEMGEWERIRLLPRGVDAITADGMGDPASTRLQGQWSEYSPSGERCSGLTGLAMQAGVPQWNGPTVAIECSDGSRRVSSQPNAFPLAHGIPARMGKLRGAGNAIVPQLAAEFIKACIEVIA